VAIPSLELLVNHSDHQVVTVITRPDAKVGRGRHSQPSAVAQAAHRLGLETLKPLHPREPEFQQHLSELGLDAVAVVAYGALIPQTALAIPKHGWINLHFSLLPAWRGAAPVQRAIEHGDDITGASTFQLVAALDAGPVYGCMTYRLPPRATSGQVLDTLSVDAAPLLVRTLDAIASGSARPEPQTESEVSYAHKLTSEGAQVRFDRPAIAVDRLIRACTPAPGAWCYFRGTKLGLGPLTTEGSDPTSPGQLQESSPRPLAASQVVATKRSVWVGTATHPVRLGQVTPAGKSAMAAAAWARGQRLTSEDHF